MLKGTPTLFELIANADVYAPEPLGINNVLVCGNKVVYVGPRLPQLDDCLDVNLTDVDGARLIPGLIDGHAHVTGGGGEAGPSTRVPPLPLSSFTGAGVTSVIGLLGTDDLTRTPQTLLTQVYGLREEGLSAWCYTGGYHIPAVTLTHSVKSDIVNLEPVIGVGEVAISDHRSSQPTREELLRLASEVHVAGLMTGKAGVVHLHLGDGKRALALVRDCLDHSEVPARVFNPTHVNRNKPLFDEACALVGRGCSIDVTAFPHGSDDHGWTAEQAVDKYLSAGLDATRLTISSDGGGCLPQFNGDGELVRLGFASCSAMAATLKNLLEQSWPLEQVLPFMTSNVANLLRLPGKGRLAAGLDADLVVLDSEHQIAHVMARGAWHLLAGRPQRKGLFE